MLDLAGPLMSPPGLGWLETLPSGKVRAAIRIGSKIVKSRAYPTEALARQAAELLLKRKVLEDTGMARITGLAPRATFGEACDRYLRRIRRDRDRYSPRTIARYEELVAAVKARFGPREIARLTEHDVELWDAQLAKDGLSTGTRILHLQALGWCVDLAVELRWLPTAPCRIQRPTKRVESPRVPISEPDLARLLEAAGPVERRVLLLAADAGLRRDEVWNLTWGDVYDRWLRVTGKGRKTRWVPVLTQRLVAELADRQHPDARVCGVPGDSGRAVAQAVRQVWRRTLKVREPNLHRLRHRFATMALAAGFSPAEVRNWLGHRSMAVTDGYTHPPGAPSLELGGVLEGRSTGAPRLPAQPTEVQRRA